MRTALIATRSGPTEEPAAEMVGVDVDGDVLGLELDDRAVVELDRRELLLALAA